MKCKNILFGLYALIIIASEISAMQLVTKQVPKSMHHVKVMSPMIQKRNIDHDLLAVIQIVGFIMCVNFIEGTLNTCPISKMIITANRLHNEVTGIGSEQCSNAYIKKEACKNPQCCKYLDPLFAYEKRFELFCDTNQERDFLIHVRDNLQKLHSKEEEAKQLLTQNKIYIEGYQKVMGLLEHKKDCYVKQAALFDRSNAEIKLLTDGSKQQQPE